MGAEEGEQSVRRERLLGVVSAPLAPPPGRTRDPGTLIFVVLLVWHYRPQDLIASFICLKVDRCVSGGGFWVEPWSCLFLSGRHRPWQSLVGMRNTESAGDLTLRLLVGEGEGVRPWLGCAGVGASGLWEPQPLSGIRHFLPSFIFSHSYFWE